MNDRLGRIDVQRRSGHESFHIAGTSLRFELGEFWRWAASDLMSNALRGVLAEFLVAHALGIDGGARTEWDACDLRTGEGVRVEVKSAAYLQSWSQRALSAPTFNIAPVRGWDAATNTSAAAACRAADVYVFALLHHRDKQTVDPLDLAQWTFYVLPATVLNERFPTQKTIGLARLLALQPACTTFEELPASVARAAVRMPRSGFGGADGFPTCARCNGPCILRHDERRGYSPVVQHWYTR